MRSLEMMFAAVAVAALATLCACASSSASLEIEVSNDSFAVFGRVLNTGAQLAEAIAAAGATSCRLKLDGRASYEHVKEAVEALQDAHCFGGMVGNLRPN